MSEAKEQQELSEQELSKQGLNKDNDENDAQDWEDPSLRGKSAEQLTKIIHKFRSEYAERRVALRDLQEKVGDMQKKWENEKTSLTTEKEKEIAAVKKQLEDKEKEYEPFKEKATKFEAYDAEKRKAIKEVLGDKWLTSFDTMPLFDLEKVFNNLMPDNKLSDHDNGKGKKPSDKDIFTMDELKKFTQKELMADKDLLAKVNKSLAFHNKK